MKIFIPKLLLKIVTSSDKIMAPTNNPIIGVHCTTIGFFFFFFNFVFIKSTPFVRS